MKETNENIESLLLRQFHGDLDREEHAALVHLWDASSALLNRPVFDTAAALKKVAGSLLEQGMIALPANGVGTLPANTGDRTRILRYAWLAAACVLAVVAGVWYFGAYSPAGEKTVFAADDNRVFTLSDSSKIYLRKGSKLTYSPDLLTGHGPRVVTLEGEAFFEVRHHSASPFRITTRQAVVEDLGTSFAIRQEDTSCEVLVTAGTVKCSARDSSEGAVILAAGEHAVLGAGGWMRYRGADPNFLSWKDHTLAFDESPLDSVLAAVQDRYGIPVTLSANLRARAGTIRVTARFGPQEQLKDVLDEIRLTTALRMEQKKDTIIFVQQ